MGHETSDEEKKDLLPTIIFGDSRRKILVTVEEAVVKPTPLNVSNTKRKRGKEMCTQMESQKTAGIPCNCETLLFTPRDHHLSSDKTEHTFHHVSLCTFHLQT